MKRIAAAALAASLLGGVGAASFAEPAAARPPGETACPRGYRTEYVRLFGISWFPKTSKRCVPIAGGGGGSTW